jgi:hypothetical protein
LINENQKVSLFNELAAIRRRGGGGRDKGKVSFNCFSFGIDF